MYNYNENIMIFNDALIDLARLCNEMNAVVLDVSYLNNKGIIQLENGTLSTVYYEDGGWLTTYGNTKKEREN